ncbi:7,8-dihydro-6-hydroxymethylpterin-pyrophosphokinase [Bifidobacterium bohemicum]|uniref:Putative 2-amino-4-hydroxy-6-hydroxymethyldihydropteridine pyrophosphokinase n=1 Tax=Bifidobacterium bohemicum DSM 22767 TaxID=1437606 RepID=A0A086ZKC7_9BIFI|nr:hypothetical protein [Bifidobacterium bohemicum]KFI46977.1 putative 2-amino-4-hydroxy-6-hydroxymethyldihydropteridine pyrophosphokinase [Bifidobacterium bohemicum DSM 22767]SCB86757.1 7,8-dihydro-6-hydroxymethylpterin-pyrophosphokinase [Bifidobacterium bohemicum]
MTDPIESICVSLGEVPVDGTCLKGSGLGGESETKRMRVRVELEAADATDTGHDLNAITAQMGEYADLLNRLKQAVSVGDITLKVSMLDGSVDRSSASPPLIASSATSGYADQPAPVSAASLASADASLAVTRTEALDNRTTVAVNQAIDPASASTSVARRAIVAMRSKALDADRRFRSVIVSLDAVPGNQVEGISPLYQVMGVDESDSMSAVVAVTARCDPAALASVLDSLERVHEGMVRLRLVDFEGEAVSGGAGQVSVEESAESASTDAANPVMPLEQVRQDAVILAPWLDMDPDARLGGDPVSYLLAMAPDVARVGRLSDRWIVGDTQ